MGGEGWVGGVVLLEDTVGEWKAYASALALVERSTGLHKHMFIFLQIQQHSRYRDSEVNLEKQFLPQIRPSARKQPARKSQAALPWSAGGMALSTVSDVEIESEASWFWLSRSGVWSLMDDTLQLLTRPLVVMEP